MTRTMLVCGVGGTPEAVVAAIKDCMPAKIVFIVSPQTRGDVGANILPLLFDDGFRIDEGQYDVMELADPEDLEACVQRIRDVGMRVHEWAARGPEFQIIVDITGGTKCMSAALALVARMWPCRYSYVGGHARTKEGAGIVVGGQEKVVHSLNPWNALGYQPAEEAVVLFDMGDYQGAIYVLTEGLKRVEREDVRAELKALRVLAEGYLAWDLFKHGECHMKLMEAEKHSNDLRHILQLTADRVLETLRRNREFLSQFKDTRPGPHFLLDLCANARRCGDKGRYDDGVARLYRAVEAAAQLRLREKHGIEDTGKLAWERLPERLRTQWAGRAGSGTLLLGLVDDFRLLEALGDGLAQRFFAPGMTGKGGALTSRNVSVLAHGWTSVSKKAFDDLWKKTVELAEIDEDDLPRFPKLGAEASQ